MKLRQKLFLIYTILAMISVLSISLYSYRQFMKSTTEQVETYSSTLYANAIEQTNRTLDDINRTLDFLSYYSDAEDFSTIELLRDFSQKNLHTPYERMLVRQKTDAVFGNLMYTNDYIQGIYLITSDGTILGNSSNNSSQIDPNYDCRGDNWYHETLLLNGKHYVSTATSDLLFHDTLPSLYLSKAIFDVYTHEYLGVLLLDLDPELLNLDNLVSLPDLALLSITNPKTGETLYSNVDTLHTDGMTYTDNKQKDELSLEPLELDVSFRYATLYDQYNPTRMMFNVLIFTFIAGEIITLYLVTQNLTFPLERLSRIMRHQRKNGFSFVSPYKKRRDEIGTLYNEYAKMLAELDESIKTNYRNKLIALDSQMKALEARINSHFLFNTLEAINSMAELDDNDDIATMSLALGDMFRYSIKTKSEIVTLAEELKHVADYVSIQSIRFSGRFHLVEDIPRRSEEHAGSETDPAASRRELSLSRLELLYDWGYDRDHRTARG